MTDATKRAIRYFGSVMGNCIHDKAYMRDIVRIAPPIVCIVVYGFPHFNSVH